MSVGMPPINGHALIGTLFWKGRPDNSDNGESVGLASIASALTFREQSPRFI